MDFSICAVAAAPVRKEPSHRSEMVNQLLFGEAMEIIAEKDEWLNIRSLHDRYEGWLTCHLVEAVTRDTAQLPVKFAATALINPAKMNGQVVNIPMGAYLPVLNETTRQLWNGEVIYEGEYRNISIMDKNQISGTALKWINAPYMWGGKTFMGVDCSGFVQTVFRVCGKQLMRDAWQQQEEGIEVATLSEASTGDLAFFHNEQGRVIHVGIVLSNTSIIHASGKVRIDTIDANGIMNMEWGKRTHTLHSIRRMF